MAGSNFRNSQPETRDAFFTRIVAEHGRLLYRVAFSALRRPADAEDAVSEALLKLLRSGAWQTITNERPFLARTVWRTALDFVARRLPEGPDAEMIFGSLEDEGPSPEGSALQGEERNLLHALIDRLPAEMRDPLLLSAVEELNSREIGELLHLPEGTVRTRLMRARLELRAQYEEIQNKTRGRVGAARGAER